MSTANPHDIAKPLFALRMTVGALRNVLGEDGAIAQPLPGTTIADTEFWEDALSEGKKQAQALLHAARQYALDVVVTAGGRQSELGALAAEVSKEIRWATDCLNRHGDIPNNNDRIAASYVITVAWHLTTALLRSFAIEQRLRKAGHQTQ